MNTIQINAQNELDARAKEYAKSHSVDYRTALYTVLKTDRNLGRRYSHGEVPMSKAYEAQLTAAQSAMHELLADPEKTKTLANERVDQLARQKIVNVGKGVADPAQAYRDALRQVFNEHPTLFDAVENGFIGENDYTLLALLIPAVAGEVRRGNYYKSSDSTRCRCGKNRAYCRGKKLAHQRGISEDSVAAFSQCIRDAQMHGDALDEIRCYFG